MASGINRQFGQRYILVQTPEQKAREDAENNARLEEIKNKDKQLADFVDKYGIKKEIPENMRNGICAFLMYFISYHRLNSKTVITLTKILGTKEHSSLILLKWWISHFNDIYSNKDYKIPNSPFEWLFHIYKNVYKLPDSISPETFIPTDILKATNELCRVAFPRIKQF